MNELLFSLSYITIRNDNDELDLRGYLSVDQEFTHEVMHL